MEKAATAGRLAPDPSGGEEGGDQALHRRPGEVGEKERAAAEKGKEIRQIRGYGRTLSLGPPSLEATAAHAPSAARVLRPQRQR